MSESAVQDVVVTVPGAPSGSPASGLSFAVERAALAAALDRVAWAVPQRTPMPILTGILLELGDGGLWLRATNLEADVRTQCDGATGRADGQMVLPAKLFADLVDRLPDGEIWVSADGDRARVSWSGGGRAVLAGFSADQYPLWPEVTGGLAVTLPTGEFVRTVRQTAFAAACDLNRRILTGVRLTLAAGGDGGVRLAALTTDAQRVAWFGPPRAALGEGAREVVVPAADLERAARVLTARGDAAVLLVRFGERSVELGGDGIVVQLRLLDGRYPAVEEMLPEPDARTARVTVARAELQAVLGRVGLVVTGAELLHAVWFHCRDGKLDLSAATRDVGEAADGIAAETDGGAFDVKMNAALLTEGLNRCDGDRVTLESHGGVGAVRVTGADGGFTYWQMPLRPD